MFNDVKIKFTRINYLVMGTGLDINKCQQEKCCLNCHEKVILAEVNFALIICFFTRFYFYFSSFPRALEQQHLSNHLVKIQISLNDGGWNHRRWFFAARPSGARWNSLAPKRIPENLSQKLWFMLRTRQSPRGCCFGNCKVISWLKPFPRTRHLKPVSHSCVTNPALLAGASVCSWLWDANLPERTNKTIQSWFLNQKIIYIAALWLTVDLTLPVVSPDIF